MRILVVGGIFAYGPLYRATVSWTPETTLEHGLRSRGYIVETLPHYASFRSVDFDIVHVHHFGQGAIRAAADSNGAPFVFTAHNEERALARRLLLREVIRRADAIVALSSAQWLRERERQPIGSALHRVIPNGVDPNRFFGGFARQRGPRKRLLYAGQLIPMKRLDVLIRSLVLLGRTDVTLALAYHVDDELSAVRHLVQHLGLSRQVEFLGRLTQPELATEYARAHALVLSSDNDALPSVVTEALLSGTPVVATDVGSVREQVGEFGIVVPGGDPVAFAEGIRRMLDDYESFERRRNDMVDYARGRFSVDAMVASHQKLYEELLALKTQPRRRRASGRPQAIMRAALIAYRVRRMFIAGRPPSESARHDRA